MNKPLLLKIINIFLILTAIGFGLWLVNQNFPLSGQIEINAIAAKDQPMLSRLGPEVRVRQEKDYQVILETPVYFDLRFLPWFKQARVQLVFQAVGSKLLGLGGQTGPEWGYDVKKPVLINDLGNGWQEAIFDFDLTKVYQQKNVRRFLISTDPRQGELKIKSLKIILIR